VPGAPQDPEGGSLSYQDSSRDRDNGQDHRQDQDQDQEGIEAVLESFTRLVQAAAEAGRDWKLVDALLHTMVDLVLETSGDLFAPPETSVAEALTDSESAAAQTIAPGRSNRRLRVEYRLRLEAVIDSWSDDETADFLMIGLRQVRRRAQQGSLYYFLVNRKRRYPVWQFDRFCTVVEGIAVVGQAFPKSWPADRVYAFMTDPSLELRHLTPAQWLLGHRDPHRVAAVIASIADR